MDDKREQAAKVFAGMGFVRCECGHIVHEDNAMVLFPSELAPYTQSFAAPTVYCRPCAPRLGVLLGLSEVLRCIDLSNGCVICGQLLQNTTWKIK